MPTRVFVDTSVLRYIADSSKLCAFKHTKCKCVSCFVSVSFVLSQVLLPSSC